MKTKMLSLFLVVLSLQAMPIKAGSSHCFSHSKMETRVDNTKSWLSKQRKKHLTRKRIVLIAAVATAATTALVAYLCKDQILNGFENVRGKLFSSPSESVPINPADLGNNPSSGSVPINPADSSDQESS